MEVTLVGTPHDRKREQCRIVVGADEAAAARSAWPSAAIVALVEASDPNQAVLARCAGADVVVPTADLAAGWRHDTPGLATAISAATTLADRRTGRRETLERSAHDLGQALSAINLASELVPGVDERSDRLLTQLKTQAKEAGVHGWRTAQLGGAPPPVLRPVDLSSLLHRVARVEADVAVYDSTGSISVLGDEQLLDQILEELVDYGRRSSATQRIEVRHGPAGLANLTFRGTGSPRRRPSDHDSADSDALVVGEIVALATDLGGRLTIEQPSGGDVATPGAPIVRLQLPILADGGSRSGLVKVPPDRMAIQANILEGVLRHAPLEESLEAVVSAIEQQLPGTKCSVLLLDDHRCLKHGAGASLPKPYRQAIDGVSIGYGQGSCGTSAYLARPVVARDVEHDPHWVDFRDLALTHGLRSCWSTPILAADGGAVLGTFAVYRSEVWEPDEVAIGLVSRFTYLAAIAIGHHRLFNALAESESRFRSAFEGVTAGMALIRLDGSFLMVNPALCAMFETDAHHLSNGNVLDFVAPSHRRRVADGWNRLLTTPEGGGVDPDQRGGGLDQEPSEIPIVGRPGAEPLWASLRTTLIRTDDGQDPYLHIEVRDVTASRRHAVERRAREAAEAANHAKSDLLALVSHELRTPLNAILGFAQVMKLIELDADQRAESVDNILKAGQHLLDLINELLDLSLIEAGQLPTTTEDLDADRVAREALQIVQPLADSRSITLRCGAEAATSKLTAEWVTDCTYRPAVLHADRQCVRQVLINLLGNAVKFTPTGGEVVVIITETADDRVRLNVVDSGPGIPANAIDGLFQPFQRLVSASQPNAAEGTGLGLALSARLVEEMNGRIGVDSRVGHGSCFWVDLPGRFGPQDAGQGAPATNQPSRSFDEPKDSATGVVLLVEDDPASVQVMTAAMALRPGLTLRVAGTAGEALAAAAGEVDVVLLDIGLPDGSGWEVLRSLRESPHHRSTPVMVLTAGPGAVPAEVPNPDRIMTKPLDVAACIEAIDDLLALAVPVPLSVERSDLIDE
jgi:signal transduction histidine kinase/CheY-like chemotaxis protein